MNSATEPTHESRVRALRDRIYWRFDPSRENFCSKANWNACKSHWLEPANVKWLEENQPKRK